MSFERIVWGCFFGKLVKLAQGHAYLAARGAGEELAERDQFGIACLVEPAAFHHQGLAEVAQMGQGAAEGG